MNLFNIGLADLGADVISFSSSLDSQLCQPNHILKDKSDIWNSGEGLPQYLIISLQQVQVPYSHIAAIGFYCWHDYTTNPKTIQIEVAQSQESPYVHWTEIHLLQQNGKQFFNMPSLPASYRFIKVIITETFGDFQTYLNQIMLMAKPLGSQTNSEMSINELQYRIKDNIQESEVKQQKHFKKVQANNGYKFSQVNSRLKEKKSRVKELSKDINYIRGKAKQIKRNQELSQNKQISLQFFQQNQSEKEIQKLKQSSYDSAAQDENKDQSFQKNLALLTLSKKVMQMEQGMQQIKRNLQVLQLKVSVSHETLQKSIIEKLQKFVETKLQKIKKELRQQIRLSRQKADLREAKSQRDKRQFIQSGQSIPIEGLSEDYQNFKGKSERHNPKSLHINNLNQTQRNKQLQKDMVVADLMTQLAKKLKERELKIKRMQQKVKHQQKSRRVKYQ